MGVKGDEGTRSDVNVDGVRDEPLIKTGDDDVGRRRREAGEVGDEFELLVVHCSRHEQSRRLAFREH